MGAAASTIVDLIPPAESLTTTLTGDALAAPADCRKEREQMEMHCMFALSTLLADCGVIETFQSIVELWPEATQGEISLMLPTAGDSIRWGATVRKIAIASESPFIAQPSSATEDPSQLLCSPLRCDGVEIGVVRVHMIKNRPDAGGSGLLDKIACKLSDFITNANALDLLTERNKELMYLHRLQAYSNIAPGSAGLEAFLTSIVEELPQSMQFPKACVAEARLFQSRDGPVIVGSQRFNEAHLFLTAPLIFGGTADTVRSRQRYGRHSTQSTNEAEEEAAEAEAVAEIAAEAATEAAAAERTKVIAELIAAKNEAAKAEDYDRAKDLKQRVVELKKVDMDLINQAKAKTRLKARVARAVGTITVAYLPLVDSECAWLREERELLASIASQVALMLRSSGSDSTSMLPHSISTSLRETGKAPPARTHCCSILFADIVGFTSLSTSATPSSVFRMLNLLHMAFDELVAARGENLYKVETIGDAYAVASGLPIASPSSAPHRHAAELIALSARLIVAASSVTITTRDGVTQPIQITCGVHTGVIVAGIVGTTNARYYLFGDTVEQCRRIVSCSEPSRVQVSAATRDALLEAWEEMEETEEMLAGESPSSSSSSKSGRNVFKNSALRRFDEYGRENYSIVAREPRVVVEGAGEMETFWVKPMRSTVVARRSASHSGVANTS